MNGSKEVAVQNKISKKKSLIIQIISNSIKKNIRQYTMIIALFSIWIIFAILTDGIFLTSRNLSNLFLQMVTIGFLACGMVLVIVATHIDLSVGSVAGTLGAVAAVLLTKAEFHPVVTILITLLCGVLVGCWHGYWISFRGVPAFIVTLSSMTAFKGLTLAITKGATIGEFPLGFKALGQGYVPKLIFKEAEFNDTSILIGLFIIALLIIFDLRKRKARISHDLAVISLPLQIAKLILIAVAVAVPCMIMASYRGIPYAVLLLITVVAILTFVTNKTIFGRHVYAIGGNKQASQLSGINIKKVNFRIFVLMGLLTALASIVFTGRLNAATTSAGNLFELDTIAACYIGGTSTLGGIGTIYGAIIGALVMTSLDNGMSLMNVEITYQYIIKGAILLFAVWIDFATKKKS